MAEPRYRGPRRYRKWSVRAWGDAKFRSLSGFEPSGKALYMFLVLGPQTGVFPAAFRSTRAGLPWFETYAPANEILPGSPALERLKSVVEMGKEKGDVPLPENESVTPERIIELRKKLGKDQVREWGR